MQARDKHLELLYVGQRGGVEAGLVRAANISFVAVEGGKIRRSAGAGLLRNLADVPTTLYNLRDILLMGVGVLQCLWIFLRFRPSVIFNKVGPAGVPVGVAAAILNIPMVLHEPDVIPGWGNRFLSRWAARIAVGFPVNQQQGLPVVKLVHTGTPVQSRLLEAKRPQSRAHFGFSSVRPLVLVFGGSQGAQALNDAVIDLLPDLLHKTQLHHLVGKYDQKRVADALLKQGIGGPGTNKGYRADPFLDIGEMAQAYAGADIVIARAGASTIAELATLGKPTILVPNRLAAAHQIANSQALEDVGAAIVVGEDPAAIGEAIETLLESPEHRKELVARMQPFSQPQAGQKLAEVILYAGGSI